MAITGADIQQLQALATKLQVTWAGQIDQLISTIDAEVTNSINIWVGNDADQFRNQIWPEHRTRLRAASTALAEAGATAKRNAQAQESTSQTVA